MNKKQELAAALAKFTPGAAVQLSENVLHPEYRSMMGCVVKTIKSRGLVTVACSNGQRYDAFPENVKLLPASHGQETDRRI